MGSFINQLVKGFVRSAVNQVGRDGGKVISNTIYGDAHAIPIRGIAMNKKNQYFDQNSSEIISPEELRERGTNEGFNVSIYRHKLSTKVAWFICALILSWSLIPSIILFIIGLQKLFQKSIYMRKKITVANYVPDRRYKTGKRLNGYRENNINIKIPANPSERSNLIKTGILYIILSFGLYYIGNTIVENLNTSENKKELYENKDAKIDSTINKPS